MDVFDAIKSRRSIRVYASKPVADDLVHRIIAAGMQSPSAGNEQPWEFLVIRDRSVLRAIAAGHPYAEMAAEAPVAILVCADMTRVKHRDYWPHDCAAAAQTMLLAAHALGLGSVWVGIYPRDARLATLREIISLPEGIIPFCLLPVGFPGEHKEPEDRFDASRIHTDGW
jgi:nitroreductase